MIMTPGLRKLALTVHLAASAGWIGAVIAYLALNVSAIVSQDVQTVRAAWIGMELTGWYAIVPLAFGSLLTGLLMSLGTQWGLFRHYWVFITLGLTLFCTVILLAHMRTASAVASMARDPDGAQLGHLGGDLLHPGVGLAVLLVIMSLNVYKQRGLTPCGWRELYEARQLTKP
jgi:hypothetical protein